MWYFDMLAKMVFTVIGFLGASICRDTYSEVGDVQQRGPYPHEGERSRWMTRKSGTVAQCPTLPLDKIERGEGEK